MGLRQTHSRVRPPITKHKVKQAEESPLLVLGLASRLIKSRGPVADSASVAMLENSSLKGELYEDRIGAVVEDEIQPDVVWEQRLKDIEAERNRRVVTSPGFSFSAAGLLFPYHLGVAQFLIQNGYIKETTPLAGSSAGAIVCAVIASGASMEEALVATKILAEDCRNRGTAFRLGYATILELEAVLRDVLDKFLPDDVHIRSNGRVRVAVTQLLWRPRGLLVDQFDSKEDLINAVFTSSFIPGYLAPRPATMFRNRLCIDGGLTLFMPPTSAAQTFQSEPVAYSSLYSLLSMSLEKLKPHVPWFLFNNYLRFVFVLSAKSFGIARDGISPDCNPENASSPRQDYLTAGCLDAAVWAKENPVEAIVQR
ncbi:Patatin-like phospholipase domain [Sesbania bispinosa]|nr:Patatin-like phospholipase domain [Sesbania bispinosa]